jgi:hypothetical protein
MKDKVSAKLFCYTKIMLKFNLEERQLYDDGDSLQKCKNPRPLVFDEHPPDCVSYDWCNY